MSKLTDQSPMPFGQHKGKPMEDVPARYLHWFYHLPENSSPSPQGAAVLEYIRENKSALAMETKNLIWD